jgi:hypothetical protein
MLTALVHAASTPGALAATLSSLVPAVAEGLVSNAVVMLPVPDPDAERIADAMGATVVIAANGHWQAAAMTARGDWVLLLEAGEVPGHGWIAAVERHLLQQTAARQRSALLPVSGFAAGLTERLAVLLGPGKLRSGLVSSRRHASQGAGTGGGAPVRLSASRERMPA